MQENHAISMTYCRHTFSRQSGALENTGPRETKSGTAAVSADRSFAPISPRILGIFSARISGREICPSAKWRRMESTLNLSLQNREFQGQFIGSLSKLTAGLRESRQFQWLFRPSPSPAGSLEQGILSSRNRELQGEAGMLLASPEAPSISECRSHRWD
jgi:hypothetical protein